MNDSDLAGPHGTGAVRRSLSKTRTRVIGSAVVCAVIGLSAWAASPASAATSASPSPLPTTGARSGPVTGGTWGTVASVSTKTFTVSTLGTSVTIDKESGTKYRKGNRSASASALKKGETVLVIGTVYDTTTPARITATEVTVDPTGGTTPAAAGVVATDPGVTVSKKVGQIPSDYTEGDGTIISGTKADDAITAALRSYPGGIVDRVVQISSTEYEVHNIDRAWPHHVFVTKSYKVVGAF
jgi:preprotein translocase subunit YajC